MWDKIIFVDYDVGSFGNSILSLLVTTSQSPLDAVANTPVMSAIGDAHRIRKLYKHSKYEFILSHHTPTIDASLAQSPKFVPIIGHSFGKIVDLMKLYPGANLVRIVSDRHTFATTFLAGCKKFKGYPSMDTIHEWYTKSWPNFDQTERGLVECLAVNFHHYITHVDWTFYPGAIVLSLKDILESKFQTVISLFEKQYGFVFDYDQVNDFVTQWTSTNKCYIEHAQRIEHMVSCIKNNTSMALNTLSFYEQALIIAFVCYDLDLDINQYPFNDSWGLRWNNTKEISKLIYNHKDFYHGKTI